MIDMGNKLKNLRIQKRWTQKQLADKVEIDESAISQYESYLRLPSLEVLVKLCSVFNVSADYFLGTEIDDFIKLPVYNLTSSQIDVIMAVVEEYRKANNQ